MPAATRHALLIGSPRNGLTAAEASVTRMRACLARRGFVVPDAGVLVGQSATRAAIVAAFDALLARVEPGDTVVLYYAGHGNLFPDRPSLASLVPSVSHPLLEPMDIADSDADHFNGLLGGELRLLLRALARLCDTVTAIFDCCHAAGLTVADQPTRDTSDADDRAAVAAVARRAGERIELRRMQPKQGIAPRRPVVVRLVASSASELAYYDLTSGLLHFTAALADALDDDALRHLAWDPLLRLVRQRVQAVCPEQRPGLEGDRDTLPFTATSAPLPAEHVHVDRRGPALRLAAGRAHGFDDGDTVELLAYTAPDIELATATVRDSEAFTAALEPTLSLAELPRALIARRIRRADTELAARLASHPDDGAIAETRTLAARRTLHAADLHTRRPGPPHPGIYGAASPYPGLHGAADIPQARSAGARSASFHLRPPVADLTVPPGHLDLLDELDPDGDGAPPQLVARLDLADPRAPDELIKALRRLEHWAGLAAQLTHTGLGPLQGCYALAWSREHPGAAADTRVIPWTRDARRARERPLPWQRHEPLPDGVELGLRVANPGHARALHVQLYRVRADRSVERVRDAAGGLAVPTGHELHVRESFDRLAHLPGPQREWLIVALGDGAFDLPLPTPAADRPRLTTYCGPVPEPGLEATRVEILGVPYILADEPCPPRRPRAPSSC
ncbi:MAG: caspase family protein [Myxococcales bacterium]|nr:caspase family protein [Myxococcales bacterium]